MRHEIITKEETAFDRLVAHMAHYYPHANCADVRDAHPVVIEHALKGGLLNALSVVRGMRELDRFFYLNGRPRRAGEVRL